MYEAPFEAEPKITPIRSLVLLDHTNVSIIHRDSKRQTLELEARQSADFSCTLNLARKRPPNYPTCISNDNQLD